MKAPPRPSRLLAPLRLGGTVALVALSLALPVSCSLGTSGIGTSSGTSTSAHGSSGSGQGGDIFMSSSSAASSGMGGASSASSSASTTSSSASSASSGAGGGGLPATWRSWNVQTSATPPYVLDDKGDNKATIVPYQSMATNDLTMDVQFTFFTPGPLQDGFSHAQDILTIPNGGNYPYVGKSSVGRGMDNGEMGAPMPLGVFDLQVYPPSPGKLTVVQFVVPLAGSYTLTMLGARRVSSNGDNATLQAYAGTKTVGGQLTAKMSQDWTTNGGGKLGMLMAGDTISFAVDAAGDSNADATEIAWIITAM